MTDTMKTIHRKLCLEFSDIKMSFSTFSSEFQAQRHVCQRHAKSFMKTTASKVLPKFLSEFTSMSDENVRQKVNDMDGTRPIQYKLCTKKDHHQQKVKWQRTLTHSPKHWWENTQNSEHIVAGPSHSTRKSDISEVSLSLWRKPHVRWTMQRTGRWTMQVRGWDRFCASRFWVPLASQI